MLAAPVLRDIAQQIRAAQLQAQQIEPTNQVKGSASAGIS